MPVHAASCAMRIVRRGFVRARAEGSALVSRRRGIAFRWVFSARAKAGVRRATASGRLDAFVGDKRSSSGVVHEITMAGATRLQCRFGYSAYLANSVSFWQMTRACGIYASMCT